MNYLTDLLLRLVLVANLAMALSVSFRWGSRLILCQGIFVGLGCYIAAHLANHHSIPLIFSICSGAFCGILLGGIMASLTHKLDSASFALITYIAGLGGMEIFENCNAFTGGRIGTISFRYPDPLSGMITPKAFAAALLIFVGIIFYYIYLHLRNSQFGRAIHALRDDPIGATLESVAPYLIERQVFMLFGFHSSIAGALWAFGLPRLLPDYFSFWSLSLQVVLACVITGGTDPKRMLVGSLIVVLLSEISQSLPMSPQLRGDVPLIFVGLIYILITIFDDPQALYRSIKNRILI